MSKCHVHLSILKPLAKVTASMDKLQLILKEEQRKAETGHMGEILGLKTIVLENMRERDKAFNAILGFSGVRWQCLEKRPEKKGEHRVANGSTR